MMKNVIQLLISLIEVGLILGGFLAVFILIGYITTAMVDWLAHTIKH